MSNKKHEISLIVTTVVISILASNFAQFGIKLLFTGNENYKSWNLIGAVFFYLVSLISFVSVLISPLFKLIDWIFQRLDRP